MTDARLRGEWLNSLRYDDLSDAAWRVFTGALMWSAENGTNGLVPDRYMKMLHPDGTKPEASLELLNGGFWSKSAAGYQLTDWDGQLGQSSAEQVETYKANARNRQRSYREKERLKMARVVGFTDSSGAPAGSGVTRDITSDVTSDVRTHVGKGTGEGKGSGYQGTAVDDEADASTGELPPSSASPSWPVVSIPNSTPPSPDVCSVPGCSNPLVSPESKAAGLCRRGDAAHSRARAA